MSVESISGQWRRGRTQSTGASSCVFDEVISVIYPVSFFHFLVFSLLVRSLSTISSASKNLFLMRDPSTLFGSLLEAANGSS